MARLRKVTKWCEEKGDAPIGYFYIRAVASLFFLFMLCRVSQASPLPGLLVSKKERVTRQYLLPAAASGLAPPCRNLNGPGEGPFIAQRANKNVTDMEENGLRTGNRI